MLLFVKINVQSVKYKKYKKCVSNNQFNSGKEGPCVIPHPFISHGQPIHKAVSLFLLCTNMSKMNGWLNIGERTSQN